jgi:hypothetical protein
MVPVMTRLEPLGPEVPFEDEVPEVPEVPVTPEKPKRGKRGTAATTDEEV